MSIFLDWDSRFKDLQIRSRLGGARQLIKSDLKHESWIFLLGIIKQL